MTIGEDDLRPVSIFQRHWWLDATAPGEWAEAVVGRSSDATAGLPYVIRQRHGLRILTMPKLTQSLGPWYVYRSGDRVSLEKKLFGELIEALPTFDVFAQNFHPDLTNWLPFYWKGFTQTTSYTYVIEDLTDLARVFSAFGAGKKGDIKKAQKQVQVTRDLTVRDLYQHLELSLAAKGEVPSYPSSLLERIHEACLSRSQGRIYAAVDANGDVHAAIFVVWDRASAYLLVSSIHPAHRASGAGSLLIWQSIQDSAAVTKQFNFEGSMIESIERSYRAFGGTQMTYSHIVGLSRRARVLTSAMDGLLAVSGRRALRL
jgi:Acetyltransferase (GNAT) domain